MYALKPTQPRLEIVERLPYHTYVDDFDSAVDVPYLVVNTNTGAFAVAEPLPFNFYIWDFESYANTLVVERDLPEFGFLKPQTMKQHFRELFRLGFDDEKATEYEAWLDEKKATEDYEDLYKTSLPW
jgi:hypothetical protein